MLDRGLPENALAMSGTAMLTIVASTNAMNVPATATASTARDEDTRRARGAAPSTPP